MYDIEYFNCFWIYVIHIYENKNYPCAVKFYIKVVFYMSISIITIKYKQIFRTNIRKRHWQMQSRVLYLPSRWHKTKLKRPILSYKRCWRTFDRQVFPHNTRKNALKSLLHIHKVISRYFARFCNISICVNLSVLKMYV